VKGRLAPFKYPRWIKFIDELPKTASGKVQRFKLRDQR
jgi:benzoate-CoA ligase